MSDPKKQVALEETPSLRNYLKTYGKEYSKKYSNAHFSSPPLQVHRVVLHDEIFSDEDEKTQYCVEAGAGIRSIPVKYTYFS